MDKRWIGLKEASELLGLPEERVRSLVEVGGMPAQRSAGGWRLSSEVVQGWKLRQERLKVQQQNLKHAQQRLGGLKEAKPNIESTSAFDLSVMDELEPPDL